MTCTMICPKPTSSNTISIIMTSHERAKQVYYTLHTIRNSTIKDIQVILVDDSVNDPIDPEQLCNIGIYVELIQINRAMKFWVNPCVNYNIGFEFVKGGKVIIQNSEVCHVGDVIEYIQRTCNDNIYYSFDVKASRNFETNASIYTNLSLTTHIYEHDLWETNSELTWYQHTIHRNLNYHFLCSMTRTTFDHINGFSYDYAFGSWYDDNDFVMKIKWKKVEIRAISNDIEHVGGIHLFHGYSHNISDNSAYVSAKNLDLFHKKQQYIDRYQQYIEISSYDSIHITDMFDTLNHV